MTIDEILRCNRRRRRLQALGAVATWFAWFHVAWLVVVFGVCVFVYRVYEAYHTPLSRIALIAYAIMAGMLLIGLLEALVQRGRMRRRFQTVTHPTTSTGWVMNRHVEGINMAVYLMHQLIVGGAIYLIEAWDSLRCIVEFDDDERRLAGQFIEALRSRGTSPRYHPLDRFRVAPVVLDKLTRAEIVRFREIDNRLHVGLERDYDAKPGTAATGLHDDLHPDPQ